MPDLHVLKIVTALGNHAEIGVEGDSDCGIKGNLKGGAHVLSPHGWNQLLGGNDLSDFSDERFPIIGFLLRLARFQHFLLFAFNVVGVGHDCLDF